MKKLSKLLCAVLVLAILCSSLIFLVGAEENNDDVSVAATTEQIFAAIKYDAEDNLFKGLSLATNTVDGWNNPGALQAHVVTTKTGATYYHQFRDGDFNLKDDATDGNEFVNYNFATATLKYEEGFHEYVIVEYDIAYEAVEGKYTVPAGDKAGENNAWKTNQQVIVRDKNGKASWATNPPLSDVCSAEFVHVTMVYDYTNGYSYAFVNGRFAKAYENGSMTAAFRERYLGGEEMVTSEWRVGSNSYDTIKLDNVYVRYTKAAEAEDTLAAAIKSGRLSDWSGNIYEGKLTYTPVADTKDFSIYKSNDEDNKMTSGSLNEMNSDFAATQVILPNGDSLIRIETLKSGDVEGHFQWNMFADVGIKYSAEAPMYAIFDMDIGTDTSLTALSFVSHIRTEKNGAGWDVGNQGGHFSTEEFLTDVTGELQHLTVIFDYNNNKYHYFLNNKLLTSKTLFSDKIYAEFKNGRIEDSTNWKGEPVTGSDYIYPGIKIQAHKSYGITPLTKDETFLLDNVKMRVLEGADAGNISAALDAKDLSDWTGAVYGEGYEFAELPVLATVDGNSYYSTGAIQNLLSERGNEKSEIKFVREPFAPLYVKANVTIDTNGMPIESLVLFDSACSAPSVNGNLYTVTVPWVNNYSVKEVTDGNTLSLGEIKYNHPGNKLGSVAFANYHTNNHRHVSFITNLDTGDVFVNDYPVGTINNASDTYVNIKPTSKIVYKKGVGQTIVFDFDMAVYDREPAALNLISRKSDQSSGAWGNDNYSVNNLFANVDLGQFAHVTIVISVDSRIAYYFINNELVHYHDNVITEEAAHMEALRCFGNSYSDLLYDNICIREINNGEIESIAAAGDLSQWSNAIYSKDYKLPVAPTLATIDGVPYGSVQALNKVLAIDSETTKEVDIKHLPFKGEERTIKILSSAVVKTHGLDVSLDWSTGIYEFVPNDEMLVNPETGVAYASSKLVHTAQGDTHTLTAIDGSNCMSYASPVIWAYDEELSSYDVVFYVFGDQIVPLTDDTRIEDGVFYLDQWKSISFNDDEELVVGDIVTEFPVASNLYSDLMYLYAPKEVADVDFKATDVRVGATVNSSIEFTVYVAKNQTISEGKIVVLGGVEYVALVSRINPSEIDKPVVVEFYVTDAEGNEYKQIQRLSFLTYAEDILTGEYNELDKKVVANLLKYANESHLLLEGSEIDSVAALLKDYESFVTTNELTDKLATEDLASVIRSAALKLNAAPEFVFKVARGFKGTIEFSYTGLRGEVKVSKHVDATKSEQLVVLNGFDVCDITADITIKATADGSNTSVEGVYNLATYAQSIDNNEFALALYNYAKAAYQHKEGLLTVTVDGVVVGEYLPGEKINIPFLRDGLTVTWYLGEQVWDFDNDVITENITLTYTEAIVKTDLDRANVVSDTLKTISESKIKQFDGCDVSTTPEDKAAYGYFDKEGGVARYVTAIKDGKPVEALYFSRTVEWPANVTDGNAYWAEHRYIVDSSRALVSFTFDYLILGTCERHNAASGESYGEGIFQIKYTAESSPDATDPYQNKAYGPETYIEDGAWHTYTYVSSEPAALEAILIKLYKFQGEMLIANINVEYAPLPTLNPDGTINTTIVSKDSIKSETLKTIVEGKIKQCDQATLVGGDQLDKDHGYFTKEGGTAVYVNAIKDGDAVEGLYFSRSVEWAASGSQNAGFTEFRFDTKNANVISFSFDYVVVGTTEKKEGDTGSDYDGTPVPLGHSYVQVKDANGSYVDMKNSSLITDGEWHTMTITFPEAHSLSNILIKLHHFQGEMVISNLVINTAE